MRFTISSTASQELKSAVDFYSSQGQDLAIAFLDDFDTACQLISDFPEIGSPIEFGNRKVVFQSYPHSVIYRVEKEMIYILAVSHQRRKPGFWNR